MEEDYFQTTHWCNTVGLPAVCGGLIMKVKKAILYFLMLLPLLVTLTALPFLPGQIPAHYGINNQVTRWGSKYEALIFPVVAILMGVFMLWMSKCSAKNEENGKNNEKVCIIAGILCLIVFNTLTGYSLYTDFKKIENLSAVSVDISRLLFGILGICMVILGSIMPKLPMNSMLGLRTGWSMKNEEIWAKSQKFGGISFILTGIMILAVCCLSKGSACILWSLGITSISLIIDIYYTYTLGRRT